MTNTAKDWKPFAERMVQELFEHPPTQALSVCRCEPDDRIVTNYHACDFEARWVLLGHIFEDIVMEIIEKNADEIRSMLEDEDE